MAVLNLAPVLLYPTAPIRLLPGDIPGYEPPAAAATGDEQPQSDSWAWFRKDEASGAYRHFSEGMTALAAALAEAGGDVDGVLGFSQGGAMAALLAAALEAAARPVPSQEDGSSSSSSWVRAVREANGGRPLRFAVIYSGFFAPPAELQWLYEPPIRTSTLHFIGSLDTVVDEGRSRALVDRCVDPLVVVHPGGHHVPVSREWAMPLVGFFKKCMVDEADGSAATTTETTETHST